MQPIIYQHIASKPQTTARSFKITVRCSTDTVASYTRLPTASHFCWPITHSPTPHHYPHTSGPATTSLRGHFESWTVLQLHVSPVFCSAIFWSIKCHCIHRVRSCILWRRRRMCHRCLPHKVMKFISCGMSKIGSEVYTPMWASNTQDFHEIVVSPTMGTDHVMDRMCLALETLAASLFGTHTGCDIASMEFWSWSNTFENKEDEPVVS